MPVVSKKEADAYDRMLDAAERLAELIESGPFEFDEDVLEVLTLFLSENSVPLLKILKHLKYRWS